MKAEGRMQNAETVSPRELSILRHTIGYDDAGNDLYPGARSLNERRNHFVTGEGCSDFVICQALTSRGLMVDYGARAVCGGDHCFSVTSEGREVVLANKPAPIKISRGRQRYLDFLRADSGMKFGEWLKCRSAMEARRI